MGLFADSILGNEKIFNVMTLKEQFRFIIRFIFSDPSKVIVEKMKVDDWLMQQLKTNDDMKIVAGELAIGITKKEIVDEIIKAVTIRKKKIAIFCGPKIFNEDNNNRLYKFILENKLDNLKVYAASLDNYPIYHFIINGNNICVEEPHFPSEATRSSLKTFIISNSIIWNNRLKIIFKKLIDKSNIEDGLKLLEPVNLEKLKEFEESPGFSEFKKRILNSRKNNE